MKKDKKVLALALSILMVMSCLSAFAANESLTVVENAAHMTMHYADDFSNKDAVGTKIQIGNSAQVDGINVVRIEEGAFVIEPVQTESHVKFYPGVVPVDPLYIEVDIHQEALFSRKGAVLRLPFTMLKERWVDLRWYGATNANGGSGYLSVPAATGDYITKPFQYTDMKLKIKVDATKGSYAIWANGELFVDEGQGAIQASGGGDDIFFQVLGDTAEFDKVTLDNLKFYTVPQTQFIMDEQVNYVKVNESLTTGETYKVSANNGNAVEIDITATTGAGYHDILLGRNTDGHHSAIMISWNSAVENSDKLDIRTYADGWINVDDMKEKASTYNANGSELKITMIYDETGKTGKLYANGNYVNEFSFNGLDATPNYVEIRVAGTISVRDIRVYNILKGMKITQEENTVKIVTPEEKSGNLYFAKYDSNAETGKTLESLGVTPLNLVPGKIYTIDKTNWAGAKAFFWDSNLTPIADSWNLN